MKQSKNLTASQSRALKMADKRPVYSSNCWWGPCAPYNTIWALVRKSFLEQRFTREYGTHYLITNEGREALLKAQEQSE